MAQEDFAASQGGGLHYCVVVFGLSLTVVCRRAEVGVIVAQARLGKQHRWVAAVPAVILLKVRLGVVLRAALAALRT